MKIFLFSLCLVFFTLFCVSVSQAAPRTEQAFVEAVRAAVQSKNQAAFLSLFNFEGADPEIKAQQIDAVKDILKSGVKSFTIEPLEPGFKDEYVFDRFTIKANMKIVKYLKMDLKTDRATETNKVSIPFGIKDGSYYFSSTVKKLKGKNAVKSDPLCIISFCGNLQGDVGKFKGSLIYIQDGKEIREDIEGKTGFQKGFNAAKVKYCKVWRVSGKKYCYFVIGQGAKYLYESPDLPLDGTPVVYEDK